MRLYAIQFEHFGPKSSRRGIWRYVVMNDGEMPRKRIDATLLHDEWQRVHDEGEEYNVYDDDGEIVGTETLLEYIDRVRGDINDPDAADNLGDLYYGRTLWGWSEPVDITDEQAATLIAVDVALDWRTEKV